MDKILGKPFAWWLQTPLYAVRYASWAARKTVEKLQSTKEKTLQAVNLSVYSRGAAASAHYDSSLLLRSGLCSQAQIESEAFRKWANLWGHTQFVSRKGWELGFICQALKERGYLQSGKRGLVFAVGAEDLPAIFASTGCEIMATDLQAEDAASIGWIETNQHTASLESLNKNGFCPPEVFRQRVSFRPVDMNNIPPDLMQGQFDFVWSACSLEHLGSIQKGQQFILNSLHCLKPGGIAVHTTEFNLSSNWLTVNSFPTCIFRKRDIEKLVGDLRAAGHHIDIDFLHERPPGVRHVDLPPYTDPSVTLSLALNGFVATSIGLIIHKKQ